MNKLYEIFAIVLVTVLFPAGIVFVAGVLGGAI